MAKVAARRKTPTELRGEQLKRAKSGEPAFGLCKSCDVEIGTRNLVDTHINDVYPIKKLSLGIRSLKDNMKENGCSKLTKIKKTLSELSTFACNSGDVPLASKDASKDYFENCSQKSEKCRQTVFRTVKDLSSTCEGKPAVEPVEMDKVLKGLFAYEKPKGSVQDTLELKYADNFEETYIVPGSKAPTDFTLKSVMRVAFGSPVNWIHRAIMASTYVGVPDCNPQLGSTSYSGTSGNILPSQIISSKALHSWVYPQSLLPPSVISVLTSSATGDGASEFLSKRQLAWEDSFRSLYYMFRKNKCNIFYVCTSQFIVLFKTSNASSGKNKRLCNAYFSRSTRTIRSLLKKHNVAFSMPLCNSEVEQPNTEVLLELAEIEKQNLGKACRPKPLDCADDSPQSLLEFCGNYSVQGLYDFLLNYRSSLNSLYGADVPVLYSPVPFQNAAICSPQIRCVGVKRIETDSSSVTQSQIHGSSSHVNFSSIEINGAYIPPWIVARVCALVGSKGDAFDISFVTDRASIGLNICMETKPDDQIFPEVDFVSDEPEALLAPKLAAAFLKRLKYNNGAYELELSPL